MIKFGTILEGAPIPITGLLYFYQPKLSEIVKIGEEQYWSLLKILSLHKEEMVMPKQQHMVSSLNDFEVWLAYFATVEDFRNRVTKAIQLFLHTKIEFLPVSNTIMIGEGDSLQIFDETVYNALSTLVRDFTNALSNDKEEEQYKETNDMSERERQLIAKMKQNAARLDKIKNGDQKNEDRLVKQIVSLVAIGKYTFEEVYNMTFVQMVSLLKKYVEIQQYELITALSPYMDSKKGQGVKHWLDT